MTDLVIAINATSDSYDFLNEGETPAEGRERAREYYNKNLIQATGNASQFKEHAKYWMDRAVEYMKILEGGFSVMTFDEYITWQKKQLTSDDPQEVTQEEYEDMLSVLPPLKFCTRGNIEMFCMREFWTGTITRQYAYNLVNCKYYSKLVDATDPDTWIYKTFA